jgi:4-carboxymuconolactone decarboxylase
MTMADDKSAMYEHGAETMRAIGNASPGPGTDRYPNLPPEQAEDVQRKLVEFCFGDTWGREGSHIDLKTRRLLTIAALVAQGKERQLRGHLGGALNQGITPEELTEAIVHLIAYVGFPSGLTALEIASEVIAARK